MKFLLWSVLERYFYYKFVENVNPFEFIRDYESYTESSCESLKTGSGRSLTRV